MTYKAEYLLEKAGICLSDIRTDDVAIKNLVVAIHHLIDVMSTQQTVIEQLEGEIEKLADQIGGTK